MGRGRRKGSFISDKINKKQGVKKYRRNLNQGKCWWLILTCSVSRCFRERRANRLGVCLCVCVCVCGKRERERERGRGPCGRMLFMSCQSANISTFYWIHFQPFSYLTLHPSYHLQLFSQALSSSHINFSYFIYIPHFISIVIVLIPLSN